MKDIVTERYFHVVLLITLNKVVLTSYDNLRFKYINFVVLFTFNIFVVLML